jgi:propane 2-monooxygenase small subunit
VSEPGPEGRPILEPGGRPGRSIPQIVLTDAEVGAAEFAGSDSRAFNYFEPKGRRATKYEDVTVDVQPDPERYLTQGWIYSFADGSRGYEHDWTRMKSSDWHTYRDPNEEWERTIYRHQHRNVMQIQQNIELAKTENAFANWNEKWLEIFAKHVSAWMHPEHGIGLYCFVKANREAPTNMHNNAISVMAIHKLRAAQDIALYNLQVSEQFSEEEFDASVHREVWLEDQIWQGVRENVERLCVLGDWAEAVFATNVVFEPLVGELFRSGFAMHAAPAQGDFVTPTIMGVIENEYERDLNATRDMFVELAEDEAHGEENREVMQEWLSHWVPYSVTAAQGLEPIWSEPEVQVVSFEESFEKARGRFEGILSDLGLQLTEELVQQ